MTEVELTELDGAEIVRGKAICAIDDNGPVFETAILTRATTWWATRKNLTMCPPTRL